MRKVTTLIALVSVISMISACSPHTSQTTNSFILPSDLRDCEILTLRKGNLSSTQINIIRCPKDKVFQYTYVGTNTTFSSGKTQANESVVFQWVIVIVMSWQCSSNITLVLLPMVMVQSLTLPKMVVTRYYLASS